MATNKHKQLPQEPRPDQHKPVIEYIGDGAEKVQFVINPLAQRYVVNGNGMVKEYM